MRLGHYILGGSITCSNSPSRSTLQRLVVHQQRSFNIRASTSLPLSRTFFKPIRSFPSLGPTRAKMSLASALAITYNTTVSAPPNALASPEDAGSKSHHLKSGGFHNPWPRCVYLIDRWNKYRIRDLQSNHMTSQLSKFYFEMAQCPKNDEDIFWAVEVSLLYSDISVRVTHI